MASELLPRWHSSPHGRAFRQCGAFLRSRNGILGTGLFSTIIIVGLLVICYMTFLTPSFLRSSDWYGLSQVHPHSPEPVYADVSLSTSSKPVFPTPTSTEEPPRLPSPSLAADELTLEQIRDIVTPTRGFYSRDYSLHLGWNNVSIRGIRCEPH
jgi:hypothetical protein